MNQSISKLIHLVVTLTLTLIASESARAFDLDTYTEQSVLSTGRWVKVSVPECGMYRITASTLRQWGFNNPQAVRVYGYGGTRIADVLSKTNYVDDLPLTPSVVTASGDVIFYGAGPETWSVSTSSRYVANNNMYTNHGYYFLTENADVEPLSPAKVGSTLAISPATAFMARLQHEQDISSPGEAGGQLTGEDFRLTPKRKFTFNLPGRSEDGICWMECSFVAKTLGASSQLSFNINGQSVPSVSSDRIAATTDDGHYHGVEVQARHDIKNFAADRLDIEVSHSATSTVYGAWLNYLTINYTRDLDMAKTDGSLNFWSTARAFELASADTTKVRVWDVTSPLSITEMKAENTANGGIKFTNSMSGMRTYAAWRDDAKLPSPQLVGVVANQNLHSMSEADMIILTPRFLANQANTIAEMHRNDKLDPLKVEVIDIELAYNEFGSGMGDISALRRLLKMVYDRSRDSEHPLRYVLLMGRATYDPRHNTPLMASANDAVPVWMGGNMKTSLCDTDGFGTDDFLAMLDDNTGNDKGLDNLSVAVGRLPFRTTEEADSYIDKLKQYVQKSKKSGWKNRLMTLADDEDQGVHLEQAERQFGFIADTPGQPFRFEKIYLDAYTKQNGNYPVARQEMYGALDEGVVWWTYIGHANNHSMTGDGQVTYNDLNNMFLKNVPVLYAATCDFLRWDSNTTSGGELLLQERYGGAIAMISATRPVYIYDNGLLSNAIGRAIAQRDEQGRLLPLGEIYRRAKNNILTDRGEHKSNSNRLRYVLMGDPAMRLATPDNVVRIDAIDGVAPGDYQPTLQALGDHTITGTVNDPMGNLLTDFNGTVTVTLYDAEESVTSNGNGDGKECTFERQGGKLFAGAAKVSGGHFTLNIHMPAEIADNFRPAALNMYALADDNYTEAVGVEHGLYVYGFNEFAEADTQEPVIEEMYLNHNTFRNGDRVNATPMLIARVSDNVGINLSNAGIGHSLSITLDGSQSLTDVSQYYTPNADSTIGGTINYPMSTLKDGSHQLALRVWDTSGNSQTAYLDFVVDASQAPKVFDVRTDANPASTTANFYAIHNRPDQMGTLTVTVYNLMGTPLWSKSVTGVSDMFESSPVTWNLCDTAGRRVSRGIYLYRAVFATGEDIYDSGSRKIAVTD